MIPYIDNRLREWRDWRFTRGGYGYRSLMGDIRDNRGAGGHTSRPGAPPSRTYAVPSSLDPELLLLTEAAVQALEPKLQRTVLLCYVGVCTLGAFERICNDPLARQAHEPLSTNDCALVLGCHRNSVGNRLHSSHQRIMDLLNDYSAGLRKWRADLRAARRRDRVSGLTSLEEARAISESILAREFHRRARSA